MGAWRAAHTLLRCSAVAPQLLQHTYSGTAVSARLLSTASAVSASQHLQSSSILHSSNGSTSSTGHSTAWGVAGFAAGAAFCLTAGGSAAQADALPAAPLAPPVTPTTPPAVDPYQRPAPTGHVPKSLTLYQYEVCPFCCKVKAFLDYYKVPYHVVEVNPLTKSELRSLTSQYKKVPVVKLDDGSIMGDSSLIISMLAAELDSPVSQPPAPAPAPSKGWLGRGSKKVNGAGAADEAEERRWRQWVDDRLVKVITANIYRNWDEAWQSFGYITDNTKWAWGTQQAARASGAIIMWRVGKKMPAKYGIEGDLRQALYHEVDLFVSALNGRDFMGGDKPNLADLAVFGVLRAVLGTPTYTDVLAHTGVGPWLMRMTVAVGDSSRLSD